MKPTIIVHACLLLCISFIISSCNNNAAENTAGTDAAPQMNGYQLVWADEFDGNSIDTTSWNFEKGGHGWGNHEQEYYQAANASVSNGNLVITGKKENIDSSHYTSARMTTKGKQEFLYGKIEARIKIPVAQGFWPAFWMLGSNIDSVGWPISGEIDIMEHINTDSLLFGTPHWDSAGHVMHGDTLAYTPSEYHVYAIEWDSTAIRWYLDGKQYHELNITNNAGHTEAFHKPFYILLNFALGGDWPGQQIDDTKLPAKMYIDYVRVYKKA